MTPPEPPTAAPARPIIMRLKDMPRLPAFEPAPPAGTDHHTSRDTAAGPPRPRPHPAPATPALPRAEANRLAADLFRAVLEVLDGKRPIRQLAGRLHPRALAKLATLTQVDRPQHSTGTRRLSTVRTSQPRAGAIEASAVFRTGQRSRAMTARIERTRGAWTCVSLHVL